MKKVFIADKPSESSYGSEFYNEECETLDELKKAIVYHELYWNDYDDEPYTEELFKKYSTAYKLFEVELHDEEYIKWHRYDGRCWFTIEKKEPNLLSIVKEIKGV